MRPTARGVVDCARWRAYDQGMDATYLQTLTPRPLAFGFPSSPQAMLERVAAAMSEAVLKLAPGESVTVTRNADDDQAPVTLRFSGPARYCGE